MLINNKIISFVAVSVVMVALLGVSPAVAEHEEDGFALVTEQIEKKQTKREKIQNMSPEEREAFKIERRAKIKKKLANMSLEERQDFFQKHKTKIKERLKNMPPEKREAFLAKLKEGKQQRSGRKKNFDEGQDIPSVETIPSISE